VTLKSRQPLELTFPPATFPTTRSADAPRASLPHVSDGTGATRQSDVLLGGVPPEGISAPTQLPAREAQTQSAQTVAADARAPAGDGSVIGSDPYIGAIVHYRRYCHNAGPCSTAIITAVGERHAYVHLTIFEVSETNSEVMVCRNVEGNNPCWHWRQECPG